MDYFDEYTKKYDLSIYQLSYKYYHSIRVMDNMELLAKNMNLPIKDITLAKCIGLLHDIGRFEEYTITHSFNYNGFDHGTYGEKVLREENALTNFDIDSSDYEVVYKAIRNHNKYKIEENLSSRELLFAKMIRDADKIDILYAFGNKKLRKIFEEDDSEISKEVKESFFQNKIIEGNNNFTQSDNIVLLLAFAYDINFNVSKEIIKKNKLYDKLYQRMRDKKKYKPYIEHINKYINERND